MKDHLALYETMKQKVCIETVSQLISKFRTKTVIWPSEIIVLIEGVSLWKLSLISNIAFQFLESLSYILAITFVYFIPRTHEKLYLQLSLCSHVTNTLFLV